MSTMNQEEVSERFFNHSNFIGYFKSDNSKHYKLMMLSNGDDTFDSDYIIHLFDISRGLLVWKHKIKVTIGGRKLREKQPAIKLYGSDYIALMDKNEKRLYLV